MRLVQNEYIKTLKKISTKIIIILLLICPVGIAGLAKFFDYQQSINQMDFTGNIDDYISNAETIKYPGYEHDIEKYTLMKECGLEYGGWRMDAVREAFNYDIDQQYTMPEEDRQKVIECVKNDDWKQYCEYQIENMKANGSDEDGYWEYSYRLGNDIPLPDNYDEEENWQNDVITQVSDAKQTLSGSNGLTAKDKEKYENIITIGLYRLDNNISVNVADCKNMFEDGKINFWSIMWGSVWLILVIGLMIIVITGGSVADEFSQGTIKFLLINPVKRWKILISKYIMSISFGYILLFLLYILTMLFSAIFFGTADLGAQYYEVVNDAVVGKSGALYILEQYLLSSVEVVMMSTLAFAISSLVRSSSLAIGISMFAMFSGTTLTNLLKRAFDQDWARYLLFANMDLGAVVSGDSPFPHQTLSFAVAIVLIHWFVFMLIAWDGFTRREV